MTIRNGDLFTDGQSDWQAFGFKTSDESECGRLILCVNDKGERASFEPWDLYEFHLLEPAKDPEAMVIFDSEVHGSKSSA